MSSTSSWVRDLDPSPRHPRTRYQAVYRDPSGKQRSAGIFDTKKAAKAALAQITVDQQGGTWRDPKLGGATFGDYSARWLAGHRVAPSTHQRYAGTLSRYLLPTFGQTRLCDLDAAAVRAWVAELHGRGLAPLTIRSANQVLRSILASAVEDGAITSLPTLRRGALPTPEKKRIKLLSISQIDAIVAATDPRYAPMVLVAAWTGMRYGEITALDWENVELDAGEIYVVQALQRATSGTVVMGPVKNRKQRTVAIDAPLVRVLKEHRLATGRRTGRVFTAPHGGDLIYSRFHGKVWTPATAKAGVKHATFHMLRHTHISLLIAQGLDWVTIAERVGHSDPSMTMKTYGHLRQDAREATFKAMDKMRKSQ